MRHPLPPTPPMPPVFAPAPFPWPPTTRGGGIISTPHLRCAAQQASLPPMALDEMVDGKGGLRPHWRSLLEVLTGLGRPALAERAQRLERIATEEGVSA